MPDARAPEDPGTAKVIRPGHKFGPREHNQLHRTAVSGIEAFSICPQYHGFAYDAGLKAVDEKPARKVGTLIHVGQAYRYGALLPQRPEWMVYPTPQAPNGRDALWTIAQGDHEPAEEALRVFDAYQAFYPIEKNIWQPVLVEHQFEVVLPIPGGPPERYTLRIDLLAYDKQTGELCLIDHKSAYRLGRNVGYGYRADREMLTALMLCRANGYDVKRVVINAMTKERPEPKFGRYDVPISAEAYNRLPRETVYWVQLMRGVAAAFPDPLDRPRTLGSCVRKYGVCLHPEAQVYCYPLMQPKRIADLRPGDTVIACDGQPTRIVRVQARPYKGKLTRVHVIGSTDTLLGTPEHLAHASTRAALGARKTERRVITHPAEWTRLDQLLGTTNRHYEPHHALRIPRVIGTIRPPTFTLTQIASKRGLSIPTRKVKATPRLASLFGYFVAEGSTHLASDCMTGVASAAFSFHRNETALHDEVCVDVLRLFGRASAVYYSKGSKSCNVVVHDTVVAGFLRDQCGTGAANKHLPGWITASTSLSIVRAAIRTLWLGDGHNGNGYRACIFTTVSKTLAHQVRLLLIRLGISSTFCRIPERPGHKVSYHVRVVGTCADQLRVIVGYRKIGRTLKRVFPSRIATDGAVVLPVRTTKQQRYTGKVYDIQVDHGRSFTTTTGVVHNCDMWPICSDGPQRLAEFTKKW